MRLNANAKINIGLDIVGKKADGYHLIETVMQSITLKDVVSVIKSKKVSVKCDKLKISENDNIAFKAAKAFFDFTGINGGAKIKIKKNIPVQAGLGGGSADAAAVIYALNKLYKTKLSNENLIKIGLTAGADVPFCIIGGTMLVRGIGEQLTELEDCKTAYLVIIKGDNGISTKEAYKKIDAAENLKTSNIEKIIDSVEVGSFGMLCKYMYNAFEQAAFDNEMAKETADLKSNGAVCAGMSGSGSAFFGIFENKKSAKKCVKTLKNSYPFAALCKTALCGVENRIGF